MLAVLWSRFFFFLQGVQLAKQGQHIHELAEVGRTGIIVHGSMISRRDRATSLLSLCQDEDPRRIWQSFRSTFSHVSSKLRCFEESRGGALSDMAWALLFLPLSIRIQKRANWWAKITTKALHTLNSELGELWLPFGSVDPNGPSNIAWRQCVGAKVANNRWHDRSIEGCGGHPRSVDLLYSREQKRFCLASVVICSSCLLLFLCNNFAGHVSVRMSSKVGLGWLIVCGCWQGVKCHNYWPMHWCTR